MYCKYVSYKNCDNRFLASIDKEIINQNRPKGTICLSTCHRLEFYSNEPFELPVGLRELFPSWMEINGKDLVLQRLATIASGADSKILGESFIAFQAIRPFLKSAISNFPYNLIDKTFEIASRVKYTHDFNTEFSYDNSAFKIFKQEQVSRPKELIVIGGGLLGQHVARNQLTRDYSKVTIVTKQVERCNRDMKSDRVGPKVKISNLVDLVRGESFDCIVATNTTNKKYNKRLITLIEDKRIGSTVDFCAVPLYPKDAKSKLNYYTMYGNEFSSLVNQANKSLQEKANLVRDDIVFMIDILLNY